MTARGRSSLATDARGGTMSVVTGDARPGRVAVIGGGPAGLMAAEGLAARGYSVDVYDAMPSVGRKFLMAGRGGLNLTHSEPAGPFLARYGDRAAQVAPWLARMDAAALRDWAHGLGVRTFVGTSGRVFPEEMKAAPPAARLAGAAARGRPALSHAAPLAGLAEDAAGGAADLRFDTPEGERRASADAVVLALGGGSWARLGSDGAWAPGLRARGVAVAPLRPANCGFDVDWSEHFRERYAGQPVKLVSMRCGDDAKARQGEFVVAQRHRGQPGLCAVGGVARSPAGRWPRDRGAGSAARLAAGKSDGGGDASARLAFAVQPFAEPAGPDRREGGLAARMRGRAGAARSRPAGRAHQALPVPLQRARPIDEAISTAGA